MSTSKSIVPTSLPPVALTFLKWQEATTGRDKVLRFIAYFSKYVIHVMQAQEISPDWQKRLKSGASNIGTTRKLIRFFRMFEYLNELLKCQTIKDDAERYLAYWKSFWLAVWMGMDHIQWLNKVGYIKVASENLKKVDEYHSKGWLFGLVAGFIIAAYKFKQALDELKVARSQLQGAVSDPTKLASVNAKLKSAEAKRNKQLMGMIKSGTDSIIPAARLGWLPVSDGVVGVAGTITSVIGIYDTWPGNKQ